LVTYGRKTNAFRRLIFSLLTPELDCPQEPSQAGLVKGCSLNVGALFLVTPDGSVRP
jgi:hypothetical protein